MNKILKILLIILGACSVIIDIMTPLVVVLFWGYFFGMTGMASYVILGVGGLATLFRAIKIGWWKKE